jgi:hypothetical protein
LNLVRFVLNAPGFLCKTAFLASVGFEQVIWFRLTHAGGLSSSLLFLSATGSSCLMTLLPVDHFSSRPVSLAHVSSPLPQQLTPNKFQ